MVIKRLTEENVIAFVQARMGSERLPGKSLMPLGEHSLLEWVLLRVSRSRLIDKVVLATGDGPVNDSLESLAVSIGISCYRGSEYDVLDRFYQAAFVHDADIIIRVCADSPCTSADEIDRLINEYTSALEEGSDSRLLYFYNNVPDRGNNYPDGLGAEVFSYSLLSRINELASLPEHREHVNQYLLDNPEEFEIRTISAPKEIAFPNLQLDIDTPADYYRMLPLMEVLSPDSSAVEVVTAADKLWGTPVSENESKLESAFLQQRNMKQVLSQPSDKEGEIPPFPTNILVEVTNNCNQKCMICANKLMSRPRRMITGLLVRNILEQAYALGAREVGFYATGEPLLHKGLEGFVALAKELGFTYCYITTNGMIADVDRVKRLVDSGLDSIKFSINAGTVGSYMIMHGVDGYKKVLSNLRDCYRWREESDAQLKIGVGFVKISVNRTDESLLRTEVNDFCDDFAVTQALSMGGYLNEWHPNSEELKTGTRPCTMVFNRAHFTCEGYLNLCCVDFQNYLAVGDLNKVSMEEAWRSSAARKLRRYHLGGNDISCQCNNCISGRRDNVVPLCKNLATPMFDIP